MKTLLLLLLALPITAQVTERYDKFKNTTVLTFHDGHVIGKQGRIKFYAYHVVEKKEYFIRFVSTSHLRLKYDDRRGLIFIVEGERIDFGKGSYDIDNTRYGLTETLTFLATRGDLERIANSPKVEFQLGTFEAELSEKQKKGVKELLEYKLK